MTPLTIENKAEFHHLEAKALLEFLKAVGAKPAIIFMDPPFNIGVDYDRANDDLDLDSYHEWFAGVLEAAFNCLADNGSLWLNLPDQLVARIADRCEVIGFHMENWCIWHYRFGVCQPKRFIHSHTHALWFSKTSSVIVNPETAQVPSDRAAYYDDARTRLEGGSRMDLDVWGFDKYWGRVQGNNRERRNLHPNQLPEKYLERVIRLCSNAGHIVCDPFCGSGTTATVAAALGRYAITGDVSETYLRSAHQRCFEGMVAR